MLLHLHHQAEEKIIQLMHISYASLILELLDSNFHSKNVPTHHPNSPPLYEVHYISGEKCHPFGRRFYRF